MVKILKIIIMLKITNYNFNNNHKHFRKIIKIIIYLFYHDFMIFLAMPIIPHAILAPAFPVLRDY
jgi:hypothetical protein